MPTSAHDTVARALSLVSESFIAASGPGGQNVNKVATAVQLRLNVYALRLSPEVFARFKQLAGSRMTAKGELLLTAQRFRTQEANRQDARERLAAFIAAGLAVPKPRIGTRPTRASKQRRLQGKRERSELKRGRSTRAWD